MRKVKDNNVKVEQEVLVDNTGDDSPASAGPEGEVLSDAAAEDRMADSPDDAADEDTEIIEAAGSDLPLEQQKIRALEEQNLRLRAEFSNYKRRIEKEQVDFTEYLKGEILKKLLPIYDDFRLMIDKTNENDSEESLMTGARMIFEKLKQLLEKEGVQPISAVGQLFDPQIHEALMMKPIEDESQNDIVLEVFQEGFQLNERLLRPTKVIVGKFDQ